MKGKWPIGVSLVFGIIALVSAYQTEADTWTGSITLTAAEPENVGGTPLLLLTPSGTVINPAGCGNTDFYVVADPVLINQLTAIAIAALSTAAKVNIEITTTSSDNCVDGRPTVATITLL